MKTRDYMREYMTRRRSTYAMRCECGAMASRLMGGKEGACAACLAKDAAQRRRVLPPPVPEEDEAACRAARYWEHKLEFWLPNPTPGWGSLEILERRLAGGI